MKTTPDFLPVIRKTLQAECRTDFTCLWSAPAPVMTAAEQLRSAGTGASLDQIERPASPKSVPVSNRK
jgi:hypothetical protein